jgi:nicotinamide-nucleotide amidase
MRVEIIAAGAELTSGQRVDTNSAWLATALAELGLHCAFHTTVSDDMADNVAAIAAACQRADIIIMTGGLGPTQDDITRNAVAAVAGAGLYIDEPSLQVICTMFARRRNLDTSPDRVVDQLKEHYPDLYQRNRIQATFPTGADVLANRVGTAPGIWMRLGRANIACLPGVPSEMKIMYREQVVPRLAAMGLAQQVTKIFKINMFGQGESEIEARALDLTARGRIPEVGITAHEATISFRVFASGPTAESAAMIAKPTLDLIHERFADLIIGTNDEDVEHALFQALLSKKATLATAESCTGGQVARKMTSQAGVSEVFLGGVVSYANSAKTAMLGVPDALLQQHGAVSAEVAAAMAEGVRTKLGADYGISTTGVAGPGGGSAEKPVGLVWLGLATPEGIFTKRLLLGEEQPRAVIQERATKHALNFLRVYLRDQKA